MYGKTSERSEQGYIFAPGELGERRFRREAQGVFGGSGVSFLLVTLLWTSKEESPRVQGRSHPLFAFEIARKARDTIQNLLLPRVQQNPLHPFGGVNTR
jgi:hypothetical protein